LKTSLSLAALFCATVGLAAPPIGLEIRGVPDGIAPGLAQRLHTALLYASATPVVTGPAVRDWFWQEQAQERQIRVVFTRYYSGQQQKVVLPMVSARYSYVLQAEGTSAVYSPAGDSLLFRAPFSFRFERPVSYQVVGVKSELPSAQMSARTHYLMETEALDSLTSHLVLLLESGAPSHPGER
jgi:hypothetical protein